jgi:hypothetical protein
MGQKVSPRFDAAFWVSRVELDTDVAAALSGTDAQKRAFRIGELAMVRRCLPEGSARDEKMRELAKPSARQRLSHDRLESDVL